MKYIYASLGLLIASFIACAIAGEVLSEHGDINTGDKLFRAAFFLLWLTILAAILAAIHLGATGFIHNYI